MEDFCGNCGAKLNLSISNNCPNCGANNDVIKNSGNQSGSTKSKTWIWLVILGVVLIGGFYLLGTINMVGGISGVIPHGAASVDHSSHDYIVALTAQQTDTATIYVTYQGGQDAAKLTSLKVVINNHDPVIWNSPKIGESRAFREGTSGKDNIVVTGTFSDGSTQVVMDTNL
jgi:hypothetical protein